MENKSNYNDVSRFKALNNTTAETSDRVNYWRSQRLAHSRSHLWEA